MSEISLCVFHSHLLFFSSSFIKQHSSTCISQTTSSSLQYFKLATISPSYVHLPLLRPTTTWNGYQNEFPTQFILTSTKPSVYFNPVHFSLLSIPGLIPFGSIAGDVVIANVYHEILLVKIVICSGFK